MVTPFNGMPPFRRFIDPDGVNPGNGSGQHAKVQVVANRVRISGLCCGTADVAFEFFEQGLDLPPGAIIFDDLPSRKVQVGRI